MNEVATNRRRHLAMLEPICMFARGRSSALADANKRDIANVFRRNASDADDNR